MISQLRRIQLLPCFFMKHHIWTISHIIALSDGRHKSHIVHLGCNVIVKYFICIPIPHKLVLPNYLI